MGSRSATGALNSAWGEGEQLTDSIDAQFHTAGALPCLVCAHVPPDIAIEPFAKTQSVATAAVANIATHTDSIAGNAGLVDILRAACVGVGAVGVVAIRVNE